MYRSTSTVINRIGLDKTVVSGFRIIRIDFKKLQKHDNGKYTYLLEDGSSFRWLKIEDFHLFGVMCAGTKKTTRIKQDYARMNVFVGDGSQGNLQNKTVAEYQRMIKRIFQYLHDEYGVTVNFQNLKFSEMEINCTFELKEEFYKVSAKFWGVVDEKSGKFPGSSLSFINTAFPNYRAPRRHRFKLLIGHFVVRSCFKEILQIFLGIQPVCSGGL